MMTFSDKIFACVKYTEYGLFFLICVFLNENNEKVLAPLEIFELKGRCLETSGTQKIHITY